MLKPSQLSQGSGPSFDELDVNHDKFISRSEVPKSLTALRAHFAEYDRDGDHRLTPQEYMTYSANQVEILTQ
ncbi:hypothetical protein ASG87_10390 [Frateuria sp. Soil773]|nr:hypothetical protein ASG87_10390 [Frateuria sp. Soil773]